MESSISSTTGPNLAAYGDFEDYRIPDLLVFPKWPVRVSNGRQFEQLSVEFALAVCVMVKPWIQGR